MHEIQINIAIRQNIVNIIYCKSTYDFMRNLRNVYQVIQLSGLDVLYNIGYFFAYNL